MNVGSLPAVLLKEPYGLPYEEGQSPRGHDPNTAPDGGRIRGAPWNADFRGEFYVGPAYQGFGSTVQEGAVSVTQPTDWDSYQVAGAFPHTGWPDTARGLQVTEPSIRGYGGPLQDVGMPVDLRAGQDLEFPTSGQQQPGGIPYLLEMPNAQGMDVGWQEWFTVNQRQLFQQPPSYGEQTTPMPAAGWP